MKTFYGFAGGKCLIPYNKSYLSCRRRSMVVYFVKTRHAMNDGGLHFSESQAENKAPNNWVEL